MNIVNDFNEGVEASSVDLPELIRIKKEIENEIKEHEARLKSYKFLLTKISEDIDSIK
jgi:hypothetical protein